MSYNKELRSGSTKGFLFNNTATLGLLYCHCYRSPNDLRKLGDLPNFLEWAKLK